MASGTSGNKPKPNPLATGRKTIHKIVGGGKSSESKGGSGKK